MAAALERIATLLSLKGENEFKTRAYTRAARQIIRLNRPVKELVDRGELQELPGIGKALAQKIEELVTTGESRLLARLEAEVPAGLLALFSIPGVGHKTAAKMVRELNLRSLEDLEEAAREGRVRSLHGLGPVVEQNILRYFQESRSGEILYHRGVALPVAEQLEDYLRREGLEAVSMAGEVRRGTEGVHHFLLVVGGSEEREALARKLEQLLKRAPGVSAVEPGAPDELLLQTVYGLPGRVLLTGLEEFPLVLLRESCSPAHWEQLQKLAREQGFQLRGNALRRDGKAVPVKSEGELYRLLGLDPVPVELREGRGEIQAAREGRLPALVELRHIRGDLHLHTDWSDGTDSIQELAREADARGYEYIAITDHSPSLQIAGGLSMERLRQQMEAIRRLNEEGGYRCRILAGAEVDILSDGTLDLPDEILFQLDLVIASVHSHFRQEREQITERICRAMEHPAVHILAHPTGRLIGSRGGYRVDVEALIRQAARTGTILEINASPQRLDLSEAYHRQARRSGVLLAVNTDAHSVATMADMGYGITAARRGGLEPGDLLNTLSWEELEKCLKRREQRKGGGGS